MGKSPPISAIAILAITTMAGAVGPALTLTPDTVYSADTGSFRGLPGLATLRNRTGAAIQIDSIRIRFGVLPPVDGRPLLGGQIYTEMDTNGRYFRTFHGAWGGVPGLRLPTLDAMVIGPFRVAVEIPGAGSDPSRFSRDTVPEMVRFFYSQGTARDSAGLWLLGKISGILSDRIRGATRKPAGGADQATSRTYAADGSARHERQHLREAIHPLYRK